MWRWVETSGCSGEVVEGGKPFSISFYFDWKLSILHSSHFIKHRPTVQRDRCRNPTERQKFSSQLNPLLILQDEIWRMRWDVCGGCQLMFWAFIKAHQYVSNVGHAGISDKMRWKGGLIIITRKQTNKMLNYIFSSSRAAKSANKQKQQRISGHCLCFTQLIWIIHRSHMSLDQTKDERRIVLHWQRFLPESDCDCQRGL